MNGAKVALTLHPGEWYFGTGYGSLRTLLGSCVAITVWHPILRCGGMCHYLLPRPPLASNDGRPDARYGNHALQFMRHAMQTKAPVHDYQVGCFGGADMFGGRIRTHVGQLNIELAQQWLHRYALLPRHSDVGGVCSRTIELNLENGSVKLKQVPTDSGRQEAIDDDQRAGGR